MGIPPSSAYTPPSLHLRDSSFRIDITPVEENKNTSNKLVWIGIALIVGTVVAVVLMNMPVSTEANIACSAAAFFFTLGGLMGVEYTCQRSCCSCRKRAKVQSAYEMQIASPTTSPSASPSSTAREPSPEPKFDKPEVPLTTLQHSQQQVITYAPRVIHKLQERVSTSRVSNSGARASLLVQSPLEFEVKAFCKIIDDCQFLPEKEWVEAIKKKLSRLNPRPEAINIIVEIALKKPLENSVHKGIIFYLKQRSDLEAILKQWQSIGDFYTRAA